MSKMAKKPFILSIYSLFIMLIFAFPIIFTVFSEIAESSIAEPRSNDTSVCVKPIKNRPDGWGGIKWGDSPEKFGKHGVLIERDGKRLEVFKKTKDTAVLGGVRIIEIRYYFVDNKLAMIDFLCAKSTKPELLSYAVEEFGKPQLTEINYTIFGWYDDIVNVCISESLFEQYTAMRFLSDTFALSENFLKFTLKPIPNKEKLKGFGSMKFGDPLELLGKDKVLITTNKALKTATYKKNQEVASYNNFKIETVLYHFSESNFLFLFYQTKLILIQIFFANTVANEQLKEYAMAQFGAPALVSADELNYQWADSSGFAIFLELHQKGKGGLLSYGFI
jgi:hypothetical protein